MKIWVDADACPIVIKDILYRCAERTHILVTFVANQSLNIPRSRYIQFIQVQSGFDVADNEIVSRVSAGDLVITSDIPLAADIIEKEGLVLSSRGELYSANNIKERLSNRNFMESLRSSGINTGGPPPLNQNDRKSFANHLDIIISKNINKNK